MSNLRRFCLLAAAVGLLTLSFWSEARSCPFCDGEKGPTLAGQFDEAPIVLYGHFANAVVSSNGVDQGTTDLIIEKVLKSHELLKGKKSITLSRYVPSKNKFIIFAEVYKGKLDAYKGMELTDNTEMLRYLEGVMNLKGKTQPERLRYAFDFLNSPETEVALDSYREFARADYGDYKDIAKKLPADTIAGWLQDPKTSSFRYGLYASLLGHCGNAKHAELLLSMINDPEKRKGSGLHGLMAAYTMLEPAKGWALLQETVQDKDKPFLVRYAGLQTMRFYWDSRPDLVAKPEVVKGVASILNLTDMADFAIEDLRKWQRWEYCDQIIDLFGKKTFNTPIVRKSILRYALQCPNPRAAEFVKTQRARDKEWVDETKELLDMETK
jgi:hypothetical protein